MKRGIRILSAALCIAVVCTLLCGCDISDYKKAISLKEQGKYEEALTMFEALGDYKDSREQADICQTAINDRAYDEAAALLEAGNYEEVIAAFAALGDYKDSREQIASCICNHPELLETFPEYRELYLDYLKQMLSGASVGDSVFFGAYEQDADEENGKEAIEWQVLDKTDKQILLISKQMLDVMGYSALLDAPYYNWENSFVRNWLNDIFYNDAFDADQQEMIASTVVTADYNPDFPSTYQGQNTADKVFLLSIKEIDRYMPGEDAKICTASIRAEQQQAYAYWLRTVAAPNGLFYTACLVMSETGDVISAGGIMELGLGVRPVIWVNIG